jgi:hypothetical protein
MQLINGLLDYSQPWETPDIYLFTGNPIVKSNSAIVMGRGAAKQVRDTFPGIDQAFGAQIIKQPDAHIMWVARAGMTQGKSTYLGWFKVKDHWQDDANISIIINSISLLARIADKHPEYNYHMNYPGIGNGKLQIDTVAPVLETLPDNVLIYR